MHAPFETRLRISVAMMGSLAAAQCTHAPADSTATIPSALGTSSDQSLWLSAGHDLSNTRNAVSEQVINASNVSKLAVKWVFQTAGDISATPAVDDTGVYFPDWGGKLYKVDRSTGEQIWSHPISDYDGVLNATARTTPAIAGDRLILGDQTSNYIFGGAGARVFAVDKTTGQKLWTTIVDSNPNAVITQSAVVVGGIAYVGVSSLEEFAATVPGYGCCSFHGSVVALDTLTGTILWQTHTTPDLPGILPGTLAYPGGAVWGSTPVVDTKRHSLYVATGNNYSVPVAVKDCVWSFSGQEPALSNCIDAIPGTRQNHIDSVLSLDLDTGAIKWAMKAIPFDVAIIGCFIPGIPLNCPPPSGPDFDFGQGASLYVAHSPQGTQRELLGIGQKSGQYWALNPDDGSVVWSTVVGPGGEEGGMMWGSAVDGQRVYSAISNTLFVPWTLTGGPTPGRQVLGGFWSSLDAFSGDILWQTAASKPPAVLTPIGTPTPPPNAIAMNQGAVTVANGVVFAGAIDANGTMYAFDAATGAILWSFESGGSVNSGAAIVDGMVFWGSGYRKLFFGTGNNKLYAFGL